MRKIFVLVKDYLKSQLTLDGQNYLCSQFIDGNIVHLSFVSVPLAVGRRLDKNEKKVKSFTTMAEEMETEGNQSNEEQMTRQIHQKANHSKEELHSQNAFATFDVQIHA
jgi:predicted double-glycine peptidase